MVSAVKMQQRSFQHIIIHGDPKSGKSTLASELAIHGYKLDWISVDNGHHVIFKLPKEALERINIYHLPDTRGFSVGISTVRKIVKGGRHMICDSHGQIDCSECKKKSNPFSTIHLDDGDPMHVCIIDHASALAESAMNTAYSKFNAKDEDAPQQEFKHHALQGFLMNEVLSAIQHGNYHCIVISHSLEVEMEDGRKKLVPHIGSREFSRNAGKYADHIVHCQVNNLAHKFGSKTTYAAMVLTGSRSDVDIGSAGAKPSLLPFFTTIIKNGESKEESKEYAASVATKLVENEAVKKQEKLEVAVEVEVPGDVGELEVKDTPAPMVETIPEQPKQLDTATTQQAQAGRSPAQILADIRAKQNGDK